MLFLQFFPLLMVICDLFRLPSSFAADDFGDGAAAVAGVVPVMFLFLLLFSGRVLLIDHYLHLALVCG